MSGHKTDPIGDDTEVAPTGSDKQLNASVVGLSDGRYAVFWQSRSTDADGNTVWNIKTKLYAQDGRALSDAIRVTEVEGGQRTRPDAISLGQLEDGTWTMVVGFQADAAGAPDVDFADQSATGVYAKTVTVDAENAVELGDPVYINNPQMFDGTAQDHQTTGPQTDVSLTPTYDGSGNVTGFTATWTSGDSADGSQLGLFAQRFNTDLEPILDTSLRDANDRPETVIDTGSVATDGSQLKSSVISFPNTARYTVAYQDDSGDAGGTVRFVSRNNDGTGPLSTEMDTGRDANWRQVDPAAARFENGKAAVAWLSIEDGAADPARFIRVQHVEPDTTIPSVGGSVRVSGDASGATAVRAPAVAKLTDDRYVVAWQRKESDTGRWETVYRIVEDEDSGEDVDGDGTTGEGPVRISGVRLLGTSVYEDHVPSPGDDPAQVQVNPRLANLKSNGEGFVAVWQIQRSDDQDEVVQRRFDINGPPAGPDEIALADRNVDEFEAGARVGQLTIPNKSEAGDSYAYQVVNDPGTALDETAFTVTDDGILKLKSDRQLVRDQLSSDTFSLDIRVTDSAGNTVVDSVDLELNRNQAVDATNLPQSDPVSGDIRVDPAPGEDAEAPFPRAANPAIAGLSGDSSGHEGHVVAWQNKAPDGSWNILAQRFNAQGVKEGDPIAVAEGDGASRLVAVSPTDSGGFLVAWQTKPAGAGSEVQDVSFQRFNAAGEAQGNPVTVAEDVQGFADIARLSDDSTVVAWQDNGNVYAKRYDANDNPVTERFQLNLGDTSGSQTRPALAPYDKAGDAQELIGVVGAYITDPGSGTDPNIRVVRHDSAGDQTDTHELTGVSGAHGAPAIVQLAGGGFVVAFEAGDDVHAGVYRPETGSFQPLASAFANSGATPEITDGSNGYTDTGRAPALAALASGGFVIGWTAPDSEGDPTVYRKVFRLNDNNEFVDAHADDSDWSPVMPNQPDGGPDDPKGSQGAPALAGIENAIPIGYAGAWHAGAEGETTRIETRLFGNNLAPEGLSLEGTPIKANLGGQTAGTLRIGEQDPNPADAFDFASDDERFTVEDNKLKLKEGYVLAPGDKTVAITVTDAGGNTITRDVTVQVEPNDQRPDYVLTHSSDYTAIARYSGYEISERAAEEFGAWTGWDAVGIADADGDDRPDLLLASGTGAFGYVSNDQFGQHSFSQVANYSDAWELVGAGSFVGQQGLDYALQKDDGTFGVVSKAGTPDAQWVPIGNYGSDWEVTGVADMNDDGTSDLVIQGAASYNAGYVAALTVTPAGGGGGGGGDGGGQQEPALDFTFNALGAFGENWEAVAAVTEIQPNEGEAAPGILMVYDDGTTREFGVLTVSDLEAGETDYTPVGSLGDDWTPIGADNFDDLF